MRNIANQLYQYQSPSLLIGLGFGVVILLARWATGNSFLFSPEVLVKYGLLGSIGFSVAGAISFLLYGLLTKRIRRQFPNGETIGDVLKGKLSFNGYKFMVILLLSLGVFSIIFQSIGAGLLMSIVFTIPPIIGASVFIILCILLGGIGGLQKIRYLSVVTVTVLFAAILILPVYSYIQEGVHPIYKGIRLYHPYILYFKNQEAFLFIITILFVAIGQLLTDRPTWQHLFTIKKDKARMTFFMLAFIWSTIPLSLTSLLMFVMSGRSFDNIITLIFNIQTTALLILFILFCVFSILSSMSNEADGIMTLFLKNIMEDVIPLVGQDYKKLRLFCSVALGIILIVVSALFLSASFSFFYFFGVLYVSLVLPMLIIILSKRKVHFLIPFSVIFSTAGGLVSYSSVGLLPSIWVGFFISCFICIVVQVYIWTSTSKEKRDGGSET